MGNNSTLVEVTGYIKVLEEGSRYFEFTLLDTEGRLLALTYVFEERSVAQNIYKSLKEGMKVNVLIEGPIEKSRADYKGIGIIRVLENKA